MDRKLRVLIGSALMLSMLVGCGAKAAEPTAMDTTITVRTTTAQSGTLSKDGSYIGTVTSENSASVYPKVSGVVSDVSVSVGDTVTEGQALCRFEDTGSVGVSQAQAQLNYQELVKAKTPKASVSGVLSEVYVRDGDSVTAGQAIARIVADTDIVADFLFTYVSPEDFYIGQSATVYITGFDGTQTGTVIAVSDGTSATSNGKDACTVRVRISNLGALTDAGTYTASAVIGGHSSYGQARISMNSASTVTADASGTIKGFKKVANSTVTAGEVLCTIDSDTLDTQISNAQLSLQSAGNAVSNYTVTAPVSGTVEAVNVTANNMASAGSVAFVISGGSGKTVTFYVTDAVRRAMTLGQPVEVSHSGTTYTGTISEISGAVDSVTGQFKVKAVLDNAAALTDGLSVELTTAAYRAEDAVLLPSDALFFEDGAAYVYVITDGTAVLTPVSVGIYTAETSAVTEGLTAGTEVITTWSASLRDGVAVRVEAEDPQSAENGASEDSAA